MISSPKQLSETEYYHKQYYGKIDLFTHLSHSLSPLFHEDTFDQDIDETVYQCYTQMKSSIRIARLRSFQDQN